MSHNDRAMKIAMVAGEASGDNLGAALMRQLRLQVPDVQFVGVGGTAMLDEGLDSLVEMDRLSVNGFIDPILRLPELISILFKIRNRILESGATCFVGIDSNFFNILLAGLLKGRGLKTVQYVSPTVWAWRSGRVRRIKRNIDLMLTLFPFEEAIYREHDIPVAFVGHPKASEIDPSAGFAGRSVARDNLEIPHDACVMAVLPGSRRSEVTTSGRDFFSALTLMNSNVDLILLPAASERRRIQIMELLASYPTLASSVRVLSGDSRMAMTAADLVLANGGTAVLEAMLLKRPVVMSYRIGRLSYLIVSSLVTSGWFALPNILADRMLVPELIQDDATPENLARAVDGLLQTEDTADLIREFDEIHHRLRKAESAAADEVLKLCGHHVSS